ncbi:hypothetical protein [Herpetosiphon giganteus]|uniref:hypothetical protein n=1 Tax=Herpetosiphon giganteus TaxID=2029754 RepID=UPI00195BC6A1|nr:hypothetical protein [Herpetosiphon giganteus]MBM7844981.1 hypothetical protein [Herpetosiphon giganteus]
MHLPIPLIYYERLANARNYFYLCHYWFNQFPDELADAIEKTAVVFFAEYPDQHYWRFVRVDHWQHRAWQQPLSHYLFYDEPIEQATFGEIATIMQQNSVLTLEPSNQVLTTASVYDRVLARLEGQTNDYCWFGGRHSAAHNQAIVDLFHGQLGLEAYYMQQAHQLQRRRLPITNHPLRQIKQIKRKC